MGPTAAKATFGLLADLSRARAPSSLSLAAGDTVLEGGTSSPESICFHSLGVSKSCADLRFDSAVCIYCSCLITSWSAFLTMLKLSMLVASKWSKILMSLEMVTSVIIKRLIFSWIDTTVMRLLDSPANL
mgnify:CR=1 FL=1